MGVKVAYGKRENVAPAIESGKIPNDSIIITRDESDTELLFYDADGELKVVAERTRFGSMEEAEQWVKKYPCKGYILNIQNDGEWVPYSVQEDNTLSPIENGGEFGNITVIDGGTTADI